MELNLRPWPTLGTVAFRESGENKPLFLVLRVRQRKGEKRLIKTLLVLFPEILKGIGNYHVDLYRKVGGQIGSKYWIRYFAARTKPSSEAPAKHLTAVEAQLSNRNLGYTLNLMVAFFLYPYTSQNYH